MEVGGGEERTQGGDKAEGAGPGGDGSPRWIFGGGGRVYVTFPGLARLPVSSTSQRLEAGSGGTIFFHG